jgi:hypothetical protein
MFRVYSQCESDELVKVMILFGGGKASYLYINLKKGKEHEGLV